MEKLKAKHNHKLTDILKVMIFGLMLILPGLIVLPSMLYYGVNEHATAPTEQVEKIEYERVNFNQICYQYDYEDTIKNDNLYSFSYENDGTNKYSTIMSFDVIEGHKYLFKGFENYNSNITIYSYCNYSSQNQLYPTGGIFTASSTTNASIYANFNYNGLVEFSYYANIFDLTRMFGSGNEPTLEEFKLWYPDDYYEYTESRYEILEIQTGTYETYTDITKQIQFNWNSLWQQPLFSWTNYTILKQGLDNFTYVFGITQTSNITNLIAYELIMVAIYIVIDIVLTLFKWLTHLIGEK